MLSLFFFFLGKVICCHCLKLLNGRIPLVAPPTSADPDCDCATLYREGFLLHLYLEDGIVGLGEVSFTDLSVYPNSFFSIEIAG